uniref:Uncharacterized protein n=1 Tax=Arundo donax TaxID=35708 RepID=A0A0A9DAI5_ARUDO
MNFTAYYCTFKHHLHTLAWAWLYLFFKWVCLWEVVNLYFLWPHNCAMPLRALEEANAFHPAVQYPTCIRKRYRDLFLSLQRYLATTVRYNIIILTRKGK